MKRRGRAPLSRGDDKRWRPSAEATATRAGDAGAAATSAVTTAEETSSALGDGGAAGDQTRPIEHKAAGLNKESGKRTEAARRDDAAPAAAPTPAEASAATYTEENRDRTEEETADGAAQETTRGGTAQQAQNSGRLGKRKRSVHDPSLVQRSCKRYKLSRYSYVAVWHGLESSNRVASTGVT